MYKYYFYIIIQSTPCLGNAEHIAICTIVNIYVIITISKMYPFAAKLSFV